MEGVVAKSPTNAIALTNCVHVSTEDIGIGLISIKVRATLFKEKLADTK
jgi:hypothetical protein